MVLVWCNSKYMAGTVPLLKSCHRRRRLFLITGGRHILHELGDHYSQFHQPPIKIFLLYAQKGGQMRQSNLPPLFSRRWSAAYWAEIWPADAASIVTSISRLPNSYLSVWFSYFFVYRQFWLFWANLASGKLAETAALSLIFLACLIIIFTIRKCQKAVQIIIFIINVWHTGGEPILWKVLLPS